MSNLPVDLNHDPPNPKDKPASHDDMSDVTGNLGRRAEVNEHEMISKVLKFSFVYSDSTKHKVAPNVIHTHWMQAVQESLGEDVVIINNQNRPVEQISTLKWTDTTIHQKQFKLYQKTTGQDNCRTTTYFILHRIQTTETISHIKALPSVKRIMREYNCYVTDHQWTETQWDTTRLGFVTNYDPSFFNRTQAAAKFNEFLHSRSLAKKTKVPLFRMVFTSPQVKHSTHTVSTKAYAIEVLHEDSVQMLQVLKTLLSSTPVFVPYSLRRKYPEGYEKAIRYQTQMLTTSMVVILQNITSDMMFYLQPRIGQIEGVRELLPSPKCNDSGRYSVLVDKVAFATVRATLITALPNWLQTDVPSDALPPEHYVTGSAQLKPLYDDGLSSGENSWMTQSNASFMSMELPMGQNDDYFRESMNANRVFSYADAAAHQLSPPDSSIEDTTTKASISEITGVQTESYTQQQRAWETLALQHQQETEKSAQVIEAQRQEIQHLKSQILEDIANRSQETLAAQVKVKEQDDATQLLREESVQTKNEVIELRKDMQQMLQQMMLAISAATVTSQENKRSSNAKENDDNSPSEKRRDVRSTPGKKLFYDEEDQRESHTYKDAMVADGTFKRLNHE
jgi:hypothetical protein